MAKRDDRYNPAHPRHSELMLECCALGHCADKARIDAAWLRIAVAVEAMAADGVARGARDNSHTINPKGD